MIRLNNCIYSPAHSNLTGAKPKEMKGLDVLTSCLCVTTVISDDWEIAWRGELDKGKLGYTSLGVENGLLNMWKSKNAISIFYSIAIPEMQLV